MDKSTHRYEEDEIEVIIEMPSTNKENDIYVINDIKTIMTNELLLQLNK